MQRPLPPLPAPKPDPQQQRVAAMHARVLANRHTALLHVRRWVRGELLQPSNAACTPEEYHAYLLELGRETRARLRQVRAEIRAMDAETQRWQQQ